MVLTTTAIWLWVKNRYPKWNFGKWKHGLKSAVPWWFNIDPQPYVQTSPSALDCYWVGSLDFNFIGNQVGFSTKPQKVKLFTQGSRQQPRGQPSGLPHPAPPLAQRREVGRCQEAPPFHHPAPPKPLDLPAAALRSAAGGIGSAGFEV